MFVWRWSCHGSISRFYFLTSANSCDPLCGVIQEEIVDETDEFIDVANKYVRFLRLIFFAVLLKMNLLHGLSGYEVRFHSCRLLGCI